MTCAASVINKVRSGIVRAYRAVKGYIREDGLLHIVVCYVLAAALMPLKWYIALAIVSAIIFAKEAYDILSGKGTGEWHDIICGYIGVALSYILWAWFILVKHMEV